MAGSLCPLCRDAHDRPRRDDRERRPAVDPGRPGVLAERSRVGSKRLPDRIRRPAPAVRPDRRSGRPATDLPHRPRSLHLRVPALRPGAEPGPLDRCAVRPGRRWSADVRGDPGHDRDDVPAAPGAGEGDRPLHLRRSRRRLDRASARRDPHRDDQLALDLLRQPPDRHRHGAVRAQARTRSRRASGSAPGRTSPAPRCSPAA